VVGVVGVGARPVVQDVEKPGGVFKHKLASHYEDFKAKISVVRRSARADMFLRGIEPDLASYMQFEDVPPILDKVVL